MAKSQATKSPSSGSNAASCVVATIFLIFVIIIVLIIFFTIFKPKNPEISVNAVQLPVFSLVNGTVTFTFSQYVSVKNPNLDVFTHYDSSFQILYAGVQVGVLFVPAGRIEAGRSQLFTATFSVRSFAIGGRDSTVEIGPKLTNGLVGSRIGPGMEIDSRLEMSGLVRLLHFFSHHVEAKSDCRIGISVSDGSIMGFRC
ncbi:uncharacterized protein LOC124932369 [Impatiens glandulifera]|uniref:uncharacterized protein LOC124932369 n=1 Tax=Impatiens glandulifera TaxID=253017 RepID=UPI001FB13E94|nr:uncharacterized protein LOC124932369 [Impatiens glandulifera]